MIKTNKSDLMQSTAVPKPRNHESVIPKPKPRKLRNIRDSKFQRYSDAFEKNGDSSSGQENPDYMITFRGQQFPVHKSILAAKSLVFHSIFSNNTDEASLSFIEHLSESAFGYFLDYFYINQVDAAADLLEIFELALKFNVTQLAVSTGLKIILNLNESNALAVFNVGYRCKVEEMKQPAFQIIKKKFPGKTDGLTDKPELVDEIVTAVVLKK